MEVGGDLAEVDLAWVVSILCKFRRLEVSGNAETKSPRVPSGVLPVIWAQNFGTCVGGVFFFVVVLFIICAGVCV